MDIAVIGSGIGGLSSAIFLARQGHQVTVYEQADSPKPVGAGFLLQPPGQHVLDKLGVYALVSKSAIPIHGLQSKTLAGRSLLDLNYKDLGDGSLCGWGVQRSTIFDALYSTASAITNINFRWGCCVEECKNEAAHAVIKVNSDSHKHELCILSSGTQSKLPAPLFQNHRKIKYPWGCLWTTLRLPEGFSEHLLQQRCKGAAKMMGILPIKRSPEGLEAALYWSMPTKTLDGLSSEISESVKREMIDFWPEIKESIQNLDSEDFTCASYNDVWTPNPVNGRIIALGDACHGTSPQLGQGCTMALLDTLSLSLNLSKDGIPLDQALNSWWQSRRKQLAFVRHMSRFLTPLYQSENAAFGIFRDNIMAPMGRLPGLNTLQLKTLASEVFLDRRLS